MDTPAQPPRCYQCGAPAIVFYQSGLKLCVHCATAYDALHQAQSDRAAQLAESLEDDLADIWGMPRPVRRPAPARVNVNTVNVQGDNHGVINTGTVRALTNSVRVVNQHDPSLAQALVNVANGIVQSTELAAAQKVDAIELLRSLSEDAAKPIGERQSKVATRALARALQGIISTSANLAKLWEAAGPMLGL